MVLNTLMQNYNSILEISLTFIGTILAIFFTLIALPIQNILGRYSQELVENVKNDAKLRFYFLYFLAIFGYDFLLLALSQNIILILLSMLLGFISLKVFYNLVNHVFYLLDVRNQIIDISNTIKGHMDSKFGNSSEIDIRNVEWLKNKIEILIDVIQKAIQENRFEIVDSGFKELEIIAKKYINLNKTILSRKQQDEFLSHIYVILIDSKNLVSVNSHPKLMTSIAKCSGEIAKENLIIDMNFNSPNIFALLFVRLLKEIVLSLELIKETSNMPEIACDQLIEVGKTAIDSEYPYVAQSIIKDLSEINKIAIKMSSFRGDDIAYRINGKIADLLNYSIENLDKIRINRNYILGSMIDEIDGNIKFYLDDVHQHFFDVIKILTGPVAENSMSVIAHTLIWKIRDKRFESTNFEKYIGNDLFDLLEKILDLLDHNIKLGIKMKKYLSALDLIENTYTIGIGLIKLINDLNDAESSEKAKKILENKVFVSLYRAISEFLKIEDSLLFNSIPIYFSLIGITFVENKDEIFSEIIEKNIEMSLNLLSEIKTNKEKRKSILYSYIRLIGLWTYKWNKNSNLFGKIIEIIKMQDEKLAKETTFSQALPIESRYYPRMLIYKHIETPIFPYNYNDFRLTNNELFNDENIQEFKNFLNELPNNEGKL